MVSPEEVRRRIEAGIDGARAQVVDTTGAGDHFDVRVTAAAFCAVERRCQAALNLDGIPQYGALIDTPMNRPFTMVYSARTGRLGANDVIYRRAARPYQRVDVADTLHLDFSDMILWGGPLASRMFGKLPPERAVAVTRQIVREYFEPAQASTRVAMVLTATLFGMALGGWMSGVIFDLTGSYRAAFVNGIAWNVLNVSIALFLLRRAGWTGGLPWLARRGATGA